MNKRIILVLSTLIGTHFITNAAENKNNTIYTTVVGVSKTIYEKIGKPLLENKILSENKALKALIWSSLGTISAIITYRTMHDIYQQKPDRSKNPILGDKILLTIACWVFAADNLLELYRNHK